MPFVWPKAGERPTKLSGAYYSSAGESVTIDTHVGGLLRSGMLVGFNPYSTSQPTVVLPGKSTNSTVLTYSIGQYHGDIAVTSGEIVTAEDVVSHWVWDAASVLAADGVTCLGYLGVGRWRRLASGQRSLFCTDLFTRIGAYEGEEVYCAGYYSDGNLSTGQTGFADNGAGTFRWDAGSTVAIDGGMVFGLASIDGSGVLVPNPSAPAGRWIRNIDSSSPRNLKWFGPNSFGVIPLPGRRKDSDAINAFVRSARNSSADLYAPEGIYSCTEAINIGPMNGITQNCTFRGAGPATTFLWCGTRYWAGASPVAAPNGETGSALFNFCAYGSTLEKLRIDVDEATHCECGVNFGFPATGSAIFVTEQTIRDVSIQGRSATLGAGSLGNGVVWDHFGRATGNIENCRLDRVSSGQCLHNILRTTFTTQPFNIVVRECGLNGGLHSVLDNPWGVGLKTESGSCSVQFTNCDFERLAVPLYLAQPVSYWAMDHCVSEQYKKLVYGHLGTTQTLQTGGIDGGRFSGGGYAQASEGDLVFPDTDRYAIEIGGSGTLRLNRANFNDGYDADTGWLIKVAAGDIVSTGNIYKHVDPFYRPGNYNNAQKQGRTFSEGDACPFGTGAGGYQINMPVLRGCESWGGTFVAVAGVTTTAVTLSKAEAGGATGYEVSFDVVSVTGTPAIGLPYVTSKANTGFTANHPDPGVGNSVVYRFRMWRN